MGIMSGRIGLFPCEVMVVVAGGRARGDANTNNKNNNCNIKMTCLESPMRQGKNAFLMDKNKTGKRNNEC